MYSFFKLNYQICDSLFRLFAICLKLLFFISLLYFWNIWKVEEKEQMKYHLIPPYKGNCSSQFNVFPSILIRDFYFASWHRLYIQVCLFGNEYFQLHYIIRIPQFKIIKTSLKTI